MPVKVRCKECQKVLKAPDKARGKAIKCPGCGAKVRVPSDEKKTSSARSSSVKSSSKRPTKKKRRSPVKEAESDGLGFLTGLDLGDSRRIEHKHISICPKCAVEIDEEDEICENCGVIIATGQLSDKEKRRRDRRGPDPNEFYPVAWSDPWQFVLNHTKLIMKTIIFWALFGSMFSSCLFMVFWCSNIPPKLFWLGLSITALLGIFGWFYVLQIEIIKLTFAKKKQLKKVAFDPFASISLGLKLIIWPFLLLIPGLSFFVYPIAMTHLAMPYTYKAFLPVTMIKLFFRTIQASLYWRLIVTVIGVVNLSIILVSILFAEPIYASTISAVEKVAGLVTEINLEEPGFVGSMVLGGTGIIIFSLLASLLALFIAPVAIYIMRLTGLYGYYNQENLELVRFQGANVKAPFGARYMARLVDILISVIFYGIVFGIIGGTIYTFNYMGGNFSPAKGEESLPTEELKEKLSYIASKAAMLTGLVFIGFIWKYFIGGETGPSQATLGKHALGLIVTDKKGRRLKPNLAWKRFFFREILGRVTFGISFVIAAFNKEQETMHDKMTKTQVLWKGDDDRS